MDDRAHITRLLGQLGPDCLYLCLQCDYNITGLAEEGGTRCPECGGRVDSWAQRRAFERQLEIRRTPITRVKNLVGAAAAVSLIFAAGWVVDGRPVETIALAALAAAWIMVSAMLAVVLGLGSTTTPTARAVLRRAYFGGLWWVHLAWVQVAVIVMAMTPVYAVITRVIGRRPDGNARSLAEVVTVCVLWFIGLAIAFNRWNKHWLVVEDRFGLERNEMISQGIGYILLLISSALGVLGVVAGLLAVHP